MSHGLIMQKYLAYLTPRTRLQMALSIVLTMVMITSLNTIFYWGIMKEELSLGVMTANAFFVGGPFVVGYFSVVNSQIQLMRTLSFKSRKDGLTGLNNRATFIELAGKRLSKQPDSALLLLDADHFKAVNDTYGHATGDRCLEAIAEHLRWNLRPDDIAGRIGGEEFAILLAGANLSQARAVAKRLIKPIPYRGGGDDQLHLSVTLSIGMSVATEDCTVDCLLQRADEALYAAKKAGRACFRIWDNDIPTAA